MKDKFDYTSHQTVRAVQWRGDNLDEIKELLQGSIENDFDGEPCAYADYIEPYYLPSSGINGGGYYILKIGSCGGIEADPGQWIILHEDGEIEDIHDKEFKKRKYTQ